MQLLDTHEYDSYTTPLIMLLQINGCWCCVLGGVSGGIEWDGINETYPVDGEGKDSIVVVCLSIVGCAFVGLPIGRCLARSHKDWFIRHLI